MNLPINTFAGELTMSSRDIADLVDVRHDNVKRTMETLRDKGLIAFTQTEEKTNGRPAIIYHVNKRDSYVVVAQLSPEFTAHLVDRWQELEKKAARPLSKAEMTLMVITDLQNEVTQQAALIEQQKPAVEFAKRIAGADKGVKLGNFAKSSGLGPRRIFEILREHNILMTGGDRHNLPYQEYIERGYFTVRQSTYEANAETRISHTPLITGKGEQWLTRRLLAVGVLKAVVNGGEV
ncbi:phage antirepressor YoqD-like protein [Oceanisphaera litoralis]|uniref:phage antirepressor KilAC domain-containing protein n=1 Tax=Oceanisphaera litoralis TaxID=225144 RepID=UPI001958AE59|nr:phage antirepressor KilAC domain-containing protein [Oceanisphaera litoralis]MBM7455201.1 phage antirepressor YoqD-like protein [Oceanisphaera litoralis]